MDFIVVILLIVVIYYMYILTYHTARHHLSGCYYNLEGFWELDSDKYHVTIYIGPGCGTISRTHSCVFIGEGEETFELNYIAPSINYSKKNATITFDGEDPFDSTILVEDGEMMIEMEDSTLTLVKNNRLSRLMIE